MVSPAGLEPAWTDLEDRRISVLPRRDGDPDRIRTCIWTASEAGAYPLGYGIEMVEAKRIELSSTGCKPVILPLNDAPGHPLRSRTAFHRFAGECLAVQPTDDRIGAGSGNRTRISTLAT